MNKSILVLDENSVIHGLVTSALETEGLTLHHEFNPGRYVERANSLMPDLILLGNSERDPNYEVCRSLKASRHLEQVPMVLLTSSKESITRDTLQRLRVAGIVRKPFEASDLQQQVSKHLNVADLIGSAYEYRRSQSTSEDEHNPLANLDVLDDEVLGMLRGTAPAMPGDDGREPVPGAPVVDDEVLAETLQPERAFEPIDSAPAAPRPRFDSLETLEGEFPSETLEMPESEDELEELGAADVLEEETPEEAVLEPQGFDQELDAGRTPRAGAATLDDIEVELPAGSTEFQAMDSELDEAAVDLFESDLAGEADASPAASGSFEESIPLSVRRMMELKPVFTMTQEESAEEEVLEPFDFEPDSADAAAIRSELETVEEVDLDVDGEEVQEQELAFASEQDVKDMEHDLEPPEDFNLMSGTQEAAKPAAAPRPAAAAARRPAPATATVLEDEELEAGEIEPDLADELAEEPAPPKPAAAAPRPPEPEPIVSSEATPEAEEDYFVEEYLGDEEIDEEQIIAADEEDGPEDRPELTPEDEAELDELLAEEEHLDDLDVLDEDELLARDEGEGEADLELEVEEEDRILTTLESERDETEALQREAERDDAQPVERQPLFERNFNALEEEAAAEEEPGETWALEQDEGGFAVADAADEPEGEVISLQQPETDEDAALADMEEVPSSALQEVDEEPPPATPAEDAEPVAVEFGEGEGDVFADEPQDEAWKPEAPPSFVGQPAEDFPVDAVKDPFVGPHGKAPPPPPPASPRHIAAEVLEDPDTLAPALQEDQLPETDLADSVLPHELEDEPAPEAEDDLEAPPSLSALADHALSGAAMPAAQQPAWDAELSDLEAEPVLEEVELGSELGGEPDAEKWEQDAQMDEAFEPVSMEAGADDPSAAVTRGEVDALLSEEPVSGEALESMLGSGDAAAPAASDTGDPEFDNLFADLQEEIAANPHGESLDDVLRKERIRDAAAAMEFALPQHENTFARAMGVYEVPGDGEGPSAYPEALQGAGAPARPAARPAKPATVPPAAAPAPSAPRTQSAAPSAAPAAHLAPAAPAAPAAAPLGSAANVSALSLLDPDIRAKLGQVLDEIISISVRKAVQEEMPKIMERMSRNA